jgi:replicative DNA helicase
MAKIFSPRSELEVLRGMFHKDASIVGTILSSVDESYFYREEAQEIYNYIKKSMSEEGSVPRYRLALEEPSISKDAREYLRESEQRIGDVLDAKRAVRILGKYRKARGLHEIAHRIDNELQGNRVDIDGLLSEIRDAFAQVSATKSNKSSMVRFGHGGNAKEFVRDLLYGEENDQYIPTGIQAYDSVNMGFPRGGLVVIGGASGAGKSHLATAIGVHQATIGYRVCVVPLEMNYQEMTARKLANVTGADSMAIGGRKLAQSEKDRAWKRYAKWEKEVRRNGGSFVLWKPDQDLDIEELFASISAENFDVVIIDYISLLKGTDGEDQWRQLSKVARVAKINAELNNRVNILLAQVDAEGKIRYSQGIKEHASVAWSFAPNREEKELGLLKIEQIKSRNQIAYPFTVRMDYAHSRVESVDENSDTIHLNHESRPNLGADEEESETPRKKRNSVNDSERPSNKRNWRE